MLPNAFNLYRIASRRISLTSFVFGTLPVFSMDDGQNLSTTHSSHNGPACLAYSAAVKNQWVREVDPVFASATAGTISVIFSVIELRFTAKIRATSLALIGTALIS